MCTIHSLLQTNVVDLKEYLKHFICNAAIIRLVKIISLRHLNIIVKLKILIILWDQNVLVATRLS